jgi:hypothetical protein
MRTFVVAAAVAVLVGCGERPPENKKGKAVNPDEAFHNPVDNKTYVAPGGWKSYKPAVPRPDEPGKKVKTDQVRLLTSQDEIAARTTVKELTSFIKEAERLAEESLENSETPFRLMVQFNCKPDGHNVKLAHQGDAKQELLQRYHDGLTAAKKLPVRDGEVAFQLEMSIRP